MDVQVLDYDLAAAAAVAESLGQEFGKTAGPVPAARATDGDAAGSGGQVGIVGEIGE